MLEITPENAVSYLRTRPNLAVDPRSTAVPLAWGVSNVVIRVEPSAGSDLPHLVLKQSRERLRTKADWFSRLDRIYREVDVLHTFAPLLPTGVVPRVLDEDQTNYAFVMEAIAADHRVWKAELLAGRADVRVAAELGTILATIHQRTWNDQELRDRWADSTVFRELRLDPFYGTVARAHPDVAPHMRSLIDDTLATFLSAVHADFSPKNVLLWNDRVTLVDFETGHFGDPRFDLGFFLSHLLLKVVHHAPRGEPILELARTFWDTYRANVDTVLIDEPRAIRHLAGCLFARIDGTSPVDYLNPVQQDTVRTLAKQLLIEPPTTVHAAMLSLLPNTEN
jgi:5-methylthioribose kinase